MKAVCLILLLAVSAIAGPQPKFPNDWTATQEDDMAVFQGDFTHDKGNYCCAEASNCQVQTQYRSGQHYFDYSHNRTRFDDVSGEVVVYDFKIQKEMLVVDQTCKEYCPMQGDRLHPGFLVPDAKDMGQVVFMDQRVEKWQFNETILQIIVMEIDTVYVDQRTDPAVPVAEQDDLTPFGGPSIGGIDTVWKDFKAGTPDPNLFIVKGVDTCRMSPNCNQQSRQLGRLKTGASKTWLHYYKAAMDESAQAKRASRRSIFDKQL